MLPFQACMDQWSPMSVMPREDSSTNIVVLEKVYIQDVLLLVYLLKALHTRCLSFLQVIHPKPISQAYDDAP